MNPVQAAILLFPFACISAGISFAAWIYAFSVERLDTSMFLVLVGYATAILAALCASPAYQLMVLP